MSASPTARSRCRGPSPTPPGETPSPTSCNAVPDHYNVANDSISWVGWAPERCSNDSISWVGWAPERCSNDSISWWCSRPSGLLDVTNSWVRRAPDVCLAYPTDSGQVVGLEPGEDLGRGLGGGAARSV